MPKFVGELRKTFQVLNLDCEGEFGAVPDRTTRRESYMTSGHAILQMLKKETNSQEGVIGYGSPLRDSDKFIGLLHNELDTATNSQRDIRPNTSLDVPFQMISQYKDNFSDTGGDSSAQNYNAPLFVTRASLRAALHEMIDREPFMAELMSLLYSIGKSK